MSNSATPHDPPSTGSRQSENISPAPKKPKSRRTKAESSRSNSRLSTGPKNTSRSRMSALKHGFRAKGITELDDAKQYQTIVEQLSRGEMSVIKQTLLKQIALEIVRIERLAYCEAEFVRTSLHPEGISLLDITTTAEMPRVEGLSYYQRLRVSSVNLLMKLLHESERQDRLSHGENVPAPLVADISLHVGGDAQASHAENADTLAHAIGVADDQAPRVGMNSPALSDAKNSAQQKSLGQPRRKSEHGADEGQSSLLQENGSERMSQKPDAPTAEMRLPNEAIDSECTGQALDAEVDERADGALLELVQPGEHGG